MPSVAVSLTPPDIAVTGNSSNSSNIPGHLAMAPRKAQPLNSTTNAQVHSRTSSFSSNGASATNTLASAHGAPADSMLRRGRVQHESNAPLTAQTILPTALSTHMFLPNNVHQQRMAAAAAAATTTTTTTSTTAAPTAASPPAPLKPKLGGRRLSMDIPSKNRNSGFLKTRKEISVEEKTVRSRAKKSGNK